MSTGISPDIVGFRASGRYGELGVVIEVTLDPNGGAEEIVVQGGASDLLVYHVPSSRIRSLSKESATVRLDVDLADFVPELQTDGTIVLRPSP